VRYAYAHTTPTHMQDHTPTVSRLEHWGVERAHEISDPLSEISILKSEKPEIEREGRAWASGTCSGHFSILVHRGGESVGQFDFTSLVGFEVATDFDVTTRASHDTVATEWNHHKRAWVVVGEMSKPIIEGVYVNVFAKFNFFLKFVKVEKVTNGFNNGD